MGALRLPASSRREASTRVIRAAATFAAAVLLAMPSIARAQSDADRAAARATAESGLNAYKAGHYAEAFDLLRRAESILHAPTHCVYMARAADKLGHLVQARELYLKVTREVLTASAPPAFVEAKKEAERELSTIEPRIPYLTIRTDSPPPSAAKIKLDDREIQDALIGVPIPVDPGEHTIVAVSGSGTEGASAHVTLVEGKRQEVMLHVSSPAEAKPGIIPIAPNGKPPAATARSTSSSEADTGAPSTVLAPAQNDANTTGRHDVKRILANSAIGVGMVGVVVGTVFVVKRSSKQFDADNAYNECKTRYCGPSEIEHFTGLDKDAATAGTIAWISYGVGAAALTTGLYLLLTRDSKQTAVRLTPAFVPYVGPHQAGATLRF